MESNNSIEELIIRYLQNEIQEDELRVLDAWIHESDANKAHFFELKGLFDTRKEVAFLNHYSVERSWERMAGKLDAISGVSVKSKVLGKQFWLSFLRYAAIIVIAMAIACSHVRLFPLRSRYIPYRRHINDCLSIDSYPHLFP